MWVSASVRSSTTRSSIVLITTPVFALGPTSNSPPHPHLCSASRSLGRLPLLRLFALLRLRLSRRLLVPLDVLLLGPGDSQGARGDVPGDHRSSSSVCGIADIYGRDQCGVNPDPDVVADHGAVFAESVPVRGDRAGADVGLLADLRVADVGQVRDLAPGADLGALDLDERPRLGPLAQRRPRADVGERAHRAAVENLALDEVRMAGRRLGAE